jgi:MoxR-like ATPase
LALPTAQRLLGLLDTLQAGLLERETAARIVLLAALAREHVLLIGPPGTAKSELARRLHRVVADAPYFERLLTRFSTPEELFGPLSLKAAGRRPLRTPGGRLPAHRRRGLSGRGLQGQLRHPQRAADLAQRARIRQWQRPFAHAAAQRGGGEQRSARGRCAAGLLRPLPAAPAAAGGRRIFRGLVAAAAACRGATRALAAERAAVLQAAAQVGVGQAALQACQALRHWLGGQGVSLSDRRWRQCIALMRTVAATEGRDQLDALDLWLAPYVASPTPDWVPRIATWFEADLLQAVPQQAPWLTRAVEAFEKQLQIEETAPADEGVKPIPVPASWPWRAPCPATTNQRPGCCA